MNRNGKGVFKVFKGFQNHWWSQTGIVGLLVFSAYFILEKCGFPVKNRHFPIRIRDLQYPLYARFGTSDRAVFNQIFAEREYACLSDVQDPKLIIDCGANVGYASVWFLNRYPHARIITIEPEDGNFDFCRKNLASYAGRVSLVHAAVWPYEAGLVVEKGKDGKEWSFQVRECRSGESSNLRGAEIHRLLLQSGFESIDILKIDIETAEKMLFLQGYESWLNKVKNIVIELHDQECEDVFLRALSFYDYRLSKSGELTVCKNISPKKILAA